MRVSLREFTVSNRKKNHLKTKNSSFYLADIKQGGSD